MKKYVLIIVMCVSLGFFTFSVNNNINNDTHNNINSLEQQKQIVNEQIIEEIIIDEDKNVISEVKYYNIPLSREYQEYLWHKCIEYNFSYEMLLSMMFVESSFRTKVISKTKDYGILQLNENTYPWIAEQIGIKNFDPFNYYHNVDGGVWYLSYLRNQWIDKGYTSEEDLFILCLMSFNKGVSGTQIWINKNGIYADYHVNKIINYKIKLESGELNIN